jgi:copper chaperone CopZ
MKHLTLFLTLLIMSFSVPVYAGQSAKVDVNGLVCDFCARALEKVFGREDAVSDIDVDLDEKIVTINFNDDQTLDDDTITELITDAGYNVEGIHRDE